MSGAMNWELTQKASVDGQVWFDRIGRMADCVPATASQPSVPGDEDVLIDDDAPTWTTFENVSNGPLEWTSAQAASGSLSLVNPYRGLGTYVTGLANLAQPLVSGSKLSLYALVDTCSPPVGQIHLRITTTTASGTVSWGEPVWDIEPSTLDKGAVPASGSWARLEVPLDTLGLDSGTLTRIDIAHVDGRVWFDRIALWPLTRAQLTSFVSDHESTVAVGATVTWTATATGTVQPLEYRFERRDDLGNWSIVQNYGMLNSYTWTPAVADVGTNAVRVSVRNGGSLAGFEDTATLLVRVVEGGEGGLWLRDPDIRLAWWKRRVTPRVPVSFGVHYGSIATTSEGSARRHSLYTPELQLLAETEITTSATPAIAYEYIWFAGQPLAQIATATDEIHWYFNDHLGTPILQTDAEAGVTWRVEYDPYGTVFTHRTGLDRHQPLRFPGQESEGGDLSYNIFRWYRAGWGRYTQSDPIGFEGGINLFAYALENPLRYKDPLGLKVYKCCAPADVAGGLVNHCWIKTDKQQTQIGFADEGQPAGIDPGGACASPFFSQTQVQIYKGSKKGTNCTEITDVDEKCVDDATWTNSKGWGATNGAWGPWNQCQSWTDDILKKCKKKCPKNEPFPTPFGPCAKLADGTTVCAGTGI